MAIDDGTIGKSVSIVVLVRYFILFLQSNILEVLISLRIHN